MPHDRHFPLAQPYWKPPFRYVEEGAMVVDANNARILDVRGWGHLCGGGSHGLPQSAAAHIQDEVGERVAQYLNTHWKI